MVDKSAKPDLIVARIAARQHGVVSVRQLRDAGLSRDAMSTRVRGGRLHPVHRGVYAVGHAGLTFGGKCMAAALACGVNAVVSHRSAAALWELLPPSGGPIHVSVPTDAGRKRRSGLCIHRRPALPLDCMIRRHGIPVTTPAQTIADLRRSVPAAQLRRAIRQAEVLGMRTGIEQAGERTRSELEHLFLRLCERHGLPRPEVNVRIGPRLVDFLWRDRRLVVETDGYRYHRGRAAFEEDRERDLELRSLGYDVLRFTHRQVTEDPGRVAGMLASALASP
jgi:very-short-patch-repair endonuclease